MDGRLRVAGTWRIGIALVASRLVELIDKRRRARPDDVVVREIGGW